MKLIGLCGKAQSGKNTAGDHLVKTLGFAEFAFGDKVKTTCMDLFGLTHDQCFTDAGKREYLPKYKKTVREILQKFGTEGCRSIYNNVWVDYVMRKIDSRPSGSCVITDVRFDDEAEAIRHRGGVLVKLVRGDYQELKGDEAVHASEKMATEYPDSYFDYVITANTGELDLIRDCIAGIACGSSSG